MRVDVKSRNCPVTMVCMAVGDHSHFACDECGAMDYTGNCETCRTMRGTGHRRIVQTFAEES